MIEATNAIVVKISSTDKAAFSVHVPPLETSRSQKIEFRYALNLNSTQNVMATCFLIGIKEALRKVYLNGLSLWDQQGSRKISFPFKHKKYTIIMWNLRIRRNGHIVECRTLCDFFFYIASKIDSNYPMSFLFFYPGDSILPFNVDYKDDAELTKPPTDTLDPANDDVDVRKPLTNKACHENKSLPGDLYDNDCDGTVDEENENGIDDDGDGLTDEDLSMPPIVNGKWGKWTPWTCFMKKCTDERGQEVRKRYCDSPRPDYGGFNCTGNNEDRSQNPCFGKGRCYKDCPAGTYGWECENKCPVECSNGTCSKLFGDCDDCKAGFELTAKCNIECHIRFYGRHCLGVCPDECLTTCDFRSGKCLQFEDDEKEYEYSSMKVLITGLTIPLSLLIPIVFCAVGCRWRKKSSEVIDYEDDELFDEE